jgi:hypothetical protein
MGEGLSDWEEYIREHSDLEWEGEELTEPFFQSVIAQCVLYFDNGN